MILMLTFVLVVGLAGCAKEKVDETDNRTLSEGAPENYPSSTISFVVPAAAGAENDLITRALNDNLDLGGTCVVENMPGASQSIGTAEVLNRKSDGQTLLTCANVGMILMPLTAELTYDMDDFRHIALLREPIISVICTRADSEIKTAEDWLEYVTSGEEYLYSHAGGAGGLGHLAATDFLGQLGSTNGQFIAYEGSAELMTAFLNGEIDWAIFNESDAAIRLKSGEMNVIYLIANEPSELCKESLPDVPCLGEMNVKNLDCYLGYKWVAVKKDVPDEIVEWIKKQLNIAIQSKEYQEYLVLAGHGETREYSEEEITEALNKSREQCSLIIKEMNKR